MILLWFYFPSYHFTTSLPPVLRFPCYHTSTPSNYDRHSISTAKYLHVQTRETDRAPQIVASNSGSWNSPALDGRATMQYKSLLIAPIYLLFPLSIVIRRRRRKNNTRRYIPRISANNKIAVGFATRSFFPAAGVSNHGHIVSKLSNGELRNGKQHEMKIRWRSNSLNVAYTRHSRTLINSFHGKLDSWFRNGWRPNDSTPSYP